MLSPLSPPAASWGKSQPPLRSYASPASRRTSASNRGCNQNPASTRNRSNSGRTAGINPRDLARIRIPATPTDVTFNTVAARRPAASSISTASACHSNASDSASVSPESRSGHARTSADTCTADDIRTQAGSTRPWKRAWFPASRENSAATAGGTHTSPKSSGSSPSADTRQRFSSTEVSETTSTFSSGAARRHPWRTSDPSPPVPRADPPPCRC